VPNVRLVRKRRLSSFRTMALGTWSMARDSSVYGALDLEVDAALDFLEAFRARTGLHATLTHLFALAVARVLVEVPDANALLRWHGIELRQDVDLFFQVLMHDPANGEIDLSGVTLRNVDRMDLPKLVTTFEAACAKVRAGKDTEKESTRQMFRRFPGWLVRPVLDLVSFLTYTLNLDLRWLGLPRDPFGGVMITNVGSLGLDEAYAPLVPYSRVPLVVSLGAVRRVPVAAPDGTVRVARVLRLGATFDHRVLDGSHAAKMVAVLKRQLADPAAAFGGAPARTV
jgi:pyruvate dehydrogenase E2 component (dihydrolipoamide acetyltransferase)